MGFNQMSGQNGARAAIIGILVIGFFVTRMTRNFVSEGGRPAADGMPPPVSESVTAEAYAEEAVPEAISYRTETEDMGAEPPALSGSADAEDISGRDGARTSGMSEDIGTGYGEAPGAAGMISEENIPEDSTEAEKAKAQTVKSPLETAEASGEALKEQVFYESISADELSERLSQASEQAARYRERAETSGSDRSVTLYLSAEYEKDLWNHELELICSCIRARLPGEDSEKLRQEEMEWLRQRDLAADRAAAERKNQSAMETTWAETAAGMTKERCYSLLTDYGELLGDAKAQEEMQTDSIPAAGVGAP